MSCSTNYEFRKQYPDTVYSIFVSESGDPIEDTHAGVISELEKLGATSDKPLVRTLRPVTNMGFLKESERLFLKSVSFYGYDPLMKTPGSPQNSTVVTDIYNSRNTSKAYAQSQFQNGMLPVNWIDNYCNPVFRIDGTNYLPGINTKEDGKEIVNGAIGIELPTCFDIQKELKTNNINSISIQSALAQYNVTSDTFQNYIVKAIAEFWIGHGYDKKSDSK